MKVRNECWSSSIKFRHDRYSRCEEVSLNEKQKLNLKLLSEYFCCCAALLYTRLFKHCNRVVLLFSSGLTFAPFSYQQQYTSLSVVTGLGVFRPPVTPRLRFLRQSMMIWAGGHKELTFQPVQEVSTSLCLLFLMNGKKQSCKRPRWQRWLRAQRRRIVSV